MVRVLIVDDHEMVRKGIKSWLDAEPDIEVVAEANRGLDVFASIRSFTPDVIVLDLHLPDKHGLDVIRELRAIGDTTPILVMTGYQKQRARAVLEAGANGFLIKEEKRERIIEAVRWAALREEGAWISPTTAAELVQTDSAIEQAHLTNMELKVLGLIEQSNAVIAEKLFLNEGTVKNHVSNIYSKLGATSRTEAASWARKQGILETKS
ncbi:MAG: response regulator transcription factor [Bacteroidota bacterium]|nr:response regulator transcription factor [Bacteroidota bacterium]MDP4234399.1 response regulator transcription factor [Bacteroidota bacterium]MDP4243332.1 response regulator transcription factor [Bacteroidota bacterium]MDP4288017.1 response regulator transcription factor [Bacteroidota bacterium]